MQLQSQLQYVPATPKLAAHLASATNENQRLWYISIMLPEKKKQKKNKNEKEKLYI